MGLDLAAAAMLAIIRSITIKLLPSLPRDLADQSIGAIIKNYYAVFH
jgi:hypothetical protein